MRMPFALLACLLAGSALAQNLDVDGGTFTINGPATYSSITVESGSTLVINGQVTVDGGVTLNGGAVLTTSAGQTLNLNAAGAVSVALGAKIDVSAKGLGPQLTYDPGTLQVVGGSTGQNGGAHGGAGGVGNWNTAHAAAYDNQDIPQLGGGGGGNDCGTGGTGGGVLHLSAGSLQLIGSIFATGGNGSGCNAGAGAGGSIWIQVGSFSGYGGIDASGGNGAGYGGGGGGGRIVIAYGTNTFTGTIRAFGGGSTTGGIGSSVLKDGSAPANITLQGGAYGVGTGTNFASVTLLNGGLLDIVGPVSVTQPLAIPAGTIVDIDSSQALAGGVSLPATVYGTLAFHVPFTLSNDLSIAGTLIVNAPLTVPNLTILQGGTATHDQGNAMSLSVTNTAMVSYGGSINTNGKGLWSQQTYDPVTGQVVGGSTAQNGGSHGGQGGYQNGNAAIAAVYDSEDQPILSGGGGGNDCGSGGHGGGAIKLTAATLQVDGSIQADGTAGSGCNAGGGAGGAIWISVTALNGAGFIEASGANGAGYGGGGGGGRIAIQAPGSTFSGTMRALGGGNGAGLGTSILKNGTSPVGLTIEYGEYHATNGETFASVTLAPGGVLALDGSATIGQPLSIPQGTSVQLNTSSALSGVTLPGQIYGTLVVNAPITLPSDLTVYGVLDSNAALTLPNLTVPSGGVVTHDRWSSLNLNVTGAAVIDSGGVVNVNGKGLPSQNSYDPNTGQVIGGSTAQNGGSHGGLGGLANGNAARAGTYDNEDQPGLAGGGGGNDCGTGGSGGGVVHLVAGTLQIDGSVQASGGNGSGCNAGAGAGGAIWIDTGTLAGVGYLDASGGNGAGYGGGGGGGRIALYYGSSTFTGLVKAHGGDNGAGVGSAKLQDKASPPNLLIPNDEYATGATTYESVSLAGNAWWDVNAATTVNQPIAIPQGTTVSLNDPHALDGIALPTQVNGGVVFNGSGLAWPSPLTINGSLWDRLPAQLGPIEVRGGGTLTDDNRLDISGDALFDTGATFTHSPHVSSSDFHVANTLTFTQGSVADGNGRGLYGGNWGSQFGCPGEAIDPNTKLLVAGAGSKSGGSYGGTGGGGSPNLLYGSATDVQYLGAGGGCSSSHGGNGGGLFRITANNLQLDGVIRVIGGAPGNDCCNVGGAGAGGGIYINAINFAGGGIIQANGGDAPSPGNGGGAGRVEIQADNNTFTGGIQTNGGNGAAPGGGSTATVGSFSGTPPSIVSSPNLYAGAGVAYSYGKGPSAIGTVPITWSLDLAPAGATIDANTGAIGWTPAGLGVGNFTLRATNAYGYVTQSFAVQVLEAPKVVSTPNPIGYVGQPYQYLVQAIGSSPITFSLSFAPTGMTIDQSGAVNWVPNGQGAFNVCVHAANPVGADDQCYLVQVAAGGPDGGGGVPPQIVTPCNPLATVDVPYQYNQSSQAQATGSLPIAWSLVKAPPGMTVALDGTITWTPQTVGGAEFVLQATNGAGSATQDCVVTVRSPNGSGPPVIVRTANLNAAVGLPYLYSPTGTIQADGDKPLSFSKIDGPSSLTVDPVLGYVAWTPTQTGPVSITIGAQNASGQDSYTFTVTVVAQPGLPPLPVITGGPFTGAAPLTVAADGTPSYSAAGILGYSWDFGDGSALAQGKTASHTYAACGGYVIRLTVTDIYGQKGTTEKPIQVSCGSLVPPAAKIVLTSVAGNGSLTASFGCDCKEGSSPIVGYQWLATDGFFSDQPADTHTFQPGGYTLQLIVVDRNGLSAVDRQQITVADATGNTPPFAIAHANPASGAAPLTVKFTADYGDTDGFISSHAWTFSSDNSTVQDDSPTRNYTQAVREHAVFTATDNGGLSTSAFVDVVVSGAGGQLPPEILSVPRTSIFAGQAYTYNKDNAPVVRGTGPFSFKLTTAPQDATIDGDGGISWTPPATMNGDAGFTLEVDGAGGSATQSWQVDVVSLGVAAPKKGCGCAVAGAPELLGLLALGGVLRRLRRYRRSCR